MANAFAMIMAGGGSEGLSALTEVRADAAVTFAGKFRLIDFSLSNCVNSDIFNVAVLTQYRPQSLNLHIGTGTPWDLDLNMGGVRLLQPYKGGPHGDWQKGTADAVRRNLEFIYNQKEEHVLILAGDHVYLMDYRPMLKQHIDSHADLTICTRRVNAHETHRYGILSMSSDNSIYEFQEKPRRSHSNLASMGIYIFKKSVLIDLLTKKDYIDFGRDMMPDMIANGYKVFGYHFPGYWADLGNIQAYWEGNMSLLAEEPALDLYDPNWIVHTRSYDKAPVRIGSHAQVADNILSNGCQVEGTVIHSVLSPGVYVAPGAVVRDSIILRDTYIGPNAEIDKCVIDRAVKIGADCKLGVGDAKAPNAELSRYINTGISVIGMNCLIPDGTSIGRNVVVHPYVGCDFSIACPKEIPSGASIGVAER